MGQMIDGVAGMNWDQETGRKMRDFVDMEQLKAIAGEILDGGEVSGVKVEQYGVEDTKIRWGRLFFLSSGVVSFDENQMRVTDKKLDQDTRSEVILDKDGILGAGVQEHPDGTKSLLIENRVELTTFVWRMTKMTNQEKQLLVNGIQT